LGLLLLALLKGKSLLAMVKAAKMATTLSSMLAFIWADSLLFGWKFGVGIALCILAHEMGHVFVNWRKGLRQSAPMFIPFVGAVIFVKQFPRDPTVQAECGAGGPGAGMLAALLCLGLAHATGSQYWLALSHAGFAINLFNLLPFPPLDGSHISAVFSPRVWSFVLIAILLWVIKVPSTMLWMVLVVGFLFRLGRGNDQRHQLATPKARSRMAALYLVLCLGLAYGSEHTTELKRPKAPTPNAEQVQAMLRKHPEVLESLPKDQPAPRVVKTEAPGPLDPIVWAFRVGLVAVAALLWSLVALLLSRASGGRLGPRGRRLVWGMLVTLFVVWGVAHLAADWLGWLLLGAYLAGTAAAVCFAAYAAAHRRGEQQPDPAALVLRSRSWAAGGALLVAYAADSLEVALVVALLAAAFYARNRWVAYSVLGSAAEGISDLERAIALRQRALAQCSDAEASRYLRWNLALLNLRLHRGGPALDVLGHLDGSLGGDSGRARTHGLQLRCYALGLLGRYHDALLCLEEMLQVPMSEDDARSRLIQIHSRLGHLARWRGWYDEYLAQTDWCLGSVAQHVTTLRAQFLTQRADALALLGRVPEALAASEDALSLTRELNIEVATACVRAEASLRAGDQSAADEASARAMSLVPGDLEVRCLRGRVLQALGSAEGMVMLHTLASEWPGEYWGRQAASLLATDRAAVA
jgi:Zn-dependent protease/tetratricopeptide (TPR) repeat protein